MAKTTHAAVARLPGVSYRFSCKLHSMSRTLNYIDQSIHQSIHPLFNRSVHWRWYIDDSVPGTVAGIVYHGTGPVPRLCLGSRQVSRSFLRVGRRHRLRPLQQGISQQLYMVLKNWTIINQAIIVVSSPAIIVTHGTDSTRENMKWNQISPRIARLQSALSSLTIVRL